MEKRKYSPMKVETIRAGTAQCGARKSKSFTDSKFVGDEVVRQKPEKNERKSH